MVAHAAIAPEGNMALFFQTRERPELARSAQVKEARASVRLVERTTNDVPAGFAARLSSHAEGLRGALPAANRRHCS